MVDLLRNELPSAIDYADDFIKVSPDASIDEIGSGYKPRYRSHLREQGISAAEMDARINRVSGLFKEAQDVDHFRELWNQSVKKSSAPKEIERIDQFIERRQNEDKDLPFQGVFHEFQKYYEEQLVQSGVDERTKLQRQVSINNKFQDSKNLNDIKRIIDPEFEQERDSAIEFSFDNMQKLLGSGIKTFGDLVKSEHLQRLGNAVVLQQEQDIHDGGYQSNYEKSFRETLNEDGVIASLGWTVEALQENFASGGLALGGAAVTAATVPISAPLATILGGTTFSGTVALGVGEVRQELEDKGVYDPEDAEYAVGAGLVVAMLDKIGAGKVIPKGEILKRLSISGAIKEIGKKSIVELGTEATQESISIATAALNGAEYEASEVVDRLIDAGIVGGAMGLGSSTADTTIRGFGNENSNTDGNLQEGESDTQGESEGTNTDTIGESSVDGTGSSGGSEFGERSEVGDGITADGVPDDLFGKTLTGELDRVRRNRSIDNELNDGSLESGGIQTSEERRENQETQDGEETLEESFQEEIEGEETSSVSEDAGEIKLESSGGRRVELPNVTVEQAHENPEGENQRTVDALLRGGNLIASSISKDFQDQSATSLVGQEVKDATDLAVAAQVYRNPSFETLRIFYVKDGAIAGHSGLSSRLVGKVNTFPIRGQNPDTAFLDLVKEEYSNLEADGFWLSHNHPLGDPKPSGSDVSATQIISQLDGTNFLGHVVINQDNYAFINGEGHVSVESLPEGTETGFNVNENPLLPHRLLGKEITAENPINDLISVAKEIEKSGYVQLIGIDKAGDNLAVKGLMEFPLSLLQEIADSATPELERSEVTLKELQALAEIRQFSKKSPARGIVLHGVPAGDISMLELSSRAIEGKILSDVIFDNGESLLEKFPSLEFSEENDQVAGRREPAILEPARPGSSRIENGSSSDEITFEAPGLTLTPKRQIEPVQKQSSKAWEKIKYTARDWFLSGRNLDKSLLESLRGDKRSADVQAQRAANLVEDLNRSISRYELRSGEKIDRAALTEYLSVQNPLERKELQQSLGIPNDDSILSAIEAMDAERNLLVRGVSDAMFQTVAFRARGIKDGPDLDVYSSWLESVQLGGPFDFESEAFEEFSEKRADVASSMRTYHTLANSEGSYLNRSYRIHDRESKWTWEKIPDKLKRAARDELLVDTLRSFKSVDDLTAKRESSKLKFLRGLPESLTAEQRKSEVENYNDQTRQAAESLRKLHEQQADFLKQAQKLGGWSQLVKKLGSNESLKPFVKKSYIGYTDKKGDTHEPLDAQASIEKIVRDQSESTDLLDFMTGKNQSSRLVTNVLLKRKGLSPVFRELFGQHKDIDVIFPRSINKSTNFLKTFGVQRKLYKWLDGLGVLSAPGDVIQGTTAFPEGKNWEFLSGRAIPTEMMDSLKSFGLVPGPTDNRLMTPFGSMIYQSSPGLAKLSSFTKSNVTVRSPSTIARNAYSAAIMGVAAAQGIPRYMTGIRGSFFKNVNTSEQLRQKNLEWLEYGVIDENVFQGNIRRLNELANETTDKLLKLDKSASSTDKTLNAGARSWEKTNEFFNHLFASGDNFARIGIYEKLKEDAKARGLDGNDINIFASERLSNSYPTYSRAVKIAQELGILPLVGNFVSFQAEAHRTAFWNYRYTKEDFELAKRLESEGKNKEAVEVRKQARGRMVGSVFALAGAEMLLGAVIGTTAEIVRFATGEDDELNLIQGEGEKSLQNSIRNLAPEWMVNSGLAYVSTSEDGNPSIVDTSQMIGHAMYMEALRELVGFKADFSNQYFEFSATSAVSAFEEGDINKGLERMAGSIKSLFGGATDQDIALQTLVQLLNNHDGFGNEIVEDTMTISEKTDAVRKHFIKAFAPGYINQAQRFYDASVGNISKSGNAPTVSDEVKRTFGVKARSFDVDVILRFRVADQMRLNRQAQSIVRDQVLDFNDVSDEKLKEVFDRRSQQHAEGGREILKFIESAQDVLTFAYAESGNIKLQTNVERKVREDIEFSLGSAGLSEADIKTLMHGEMPNLRISISKESIRSKLRSAPEASVLDGNPGEVTRRLRIIKEMTNEFNKSI